MLSCAKRVLPECRPCPGRGGIRSEMGNVNGLTETAIDPGLTSALHGLRLYDRYLRTSEAVGNFRAGAPR